MPHSNVVTLTIEPLDPFTFTDENGNQVIGHQRMRVRVADREPQDLDLNPTNGTWTWEQIKTFLNAKDVE